MTNDKYIVHDMDGTLDVFEDYELYLDYFKTVYLPAGFGTRWKYNKITKKAMEVHMDLVCV